MKEKKLQNKRILLLFIIISLLLSFMSIPYVNILMNIWNTLLIGWIYSVIVFRLKGNYSLVFGVVLIFLAIIPLYFTGSIDKHLGGLIFIVLLIGIFQKFFFSK